MKNLEVITDQETFRDSAIRLSLPTLEGEDQLDVSDTLRLCRLGGGVLQFAQTIFNSQTLGVYGQLHDRAPEGRGAHFDLYHDLVHSSHQFIGIFNLSGKAKLTAAHLPDDLAKAYFERFPKPSDAATQARRHFSSAVLIDPATDIYEGELEAGTGMVIAQREDKPHVIHNIVPTDPDNPGKFVKLIRLRDSRKVLQRAKMLGMKPLDELITDSLTGPSTEVLGSIPVDRTLPRVPASPERLISRQQGERRSRSGSRVRS